MPQNKHSQKKLDRNWYPQFEILGSFIPYLYLGGSQEFRNQQKELFLSKEIRNPQLDYPKLDAEVLYAHKKKLELFLHEIEGTETDQLVKEVYVHKIREKIQEINLLLAAHSGIQEQILDLSISLYGKPRKDIFEYTINRLRKETQTHAKSPNSIIADAAFELDRELAELTHGFKTSLTLISLPSKKTVEKVKQATFHEFQEVIEEISDKTEFHAEDIEKYFKKALKVLKMHNWKTVIDDDSTSIHVDQEHSTIVVPQTRVLNSSDLQGLILHEICTHALRRTNGNKSSLLLLGLGLSKYDVGDEGIATVREQLVEQEIEDFARMERHISISLAIGLDGKKRDFREVFEITKKILLFRNLIRGNNFETALFNAESLAWGTCVRTFRGSDCKTPGVCLTKDIIYQEGNIGIWELLSENQDELVRFNVGKYNPLNPSHIEILEKIGL